MIGAFDELVGLRAHDLVITNAIAHSYSAECKRFLRQGAVGAGKHLALTNAKPRAQSSKTMSTTSGVQYAPQHLLMCTATMLSMLKQ